MSNLKIAAQLMRIDKPIGFLLIIWPSMWSLWYCSKGSPNLLMTGLILLGAILTRSAGCIINDIFDYDIDPFVKRTKDRPLALKLWSRAQAFSLFAILIFIAALIAYNLSVLKSSFLACIAIVIYPLMKRFISAPQVWLAITWGFSVIIVWEAHKLSYSNSILFLYLVSAFWVLAFDTLYGLADMKDDIRINIQSTAILLGSRVLTGVFLSYVGMFVFWILFALTIKNNIFVLTSSMIIILFGYLTKKFCETKDPKKCILAFRANNALGFILWLSLLTAF